jgi:hypothetical protein
VYVEVMYSKVMNKGKDDKAQRDDTQSKSLICERAQAMNVRRRKNPG